MAKKKSTRHLTVFLLKNGLSGYEDAVKDADTLQKYEFKDSVPFRGVLYVKPTQTKRPSWLSFVEPAVVGDLSTLFTSNCSAVLLLTASQRKFALTFGYGRSLLKPEAYERDFGLKVTLNTVDPDNLRSVDARRIEELSVHTKKDTSRGSSFNAFGLDVSQDLLRAVAGTPKIVGFARRVAGSDALAINTKVEFAELQAKCTELLKAYRSKKYQERFGFIDQLRPLNDPVKIALLNDKLVKQLQKKDTDGIHLATSKPLDWEDVTGFSYTGRRNDEPLPELDIDDYLSSLDDPQSLTLETLKNHQVKVYYHEADHSVAECSVYSAIVYQATQGKTLYVRSDGEWFEVKKDFAEGVTTHIKQLSKKATLTLPDAVKGESEGVYNGKAATAKKYILMDADCVRAGNPKSSIEVCDLLTPGKQFVHVKKKTRSSTLSHLFAQGVVSAELFFSDDDFREQARAKVEKKAKSHATLIPKTRPNAQDYEVVYAIVTHRSKNWPQYLPFFSQLNLSNAADRIGRLGFKVSLVRVHEV